MDRPLILALKLVLTRKKSVGSAGKKMSNGAGFLMLGYIYKCWNIFVRCILSSFTISGGSPYPKMDGRQILTSLEAGYRMPRPQHVDDKLYEKILSLLSFLLGHLLS